MAKELNGKKERIQSIDILRGIVIIIMALDHTRDYFHYGAFLTDPTNLETTTPILFFTRFITHFCAPIFIALAGTSAYLYGRSHSKKELSKFLLKRGLFLVVLELIVMNFMWWFDPGFHFINVQVIWAIGICFILLAGLIHLPLKWIGGLGLLLVFGHNALDAIQLQAGQIKNIWWYILHQPSYIGLSSTRGAYVTYPVIPWIGVMMVGYVIGELFVQSDGEKRRKFLLYSGLVSVVLFVVARLVSVYGDSIKWINDDASISSVLSFFSVTKYPPSLHFLLITLGGGAILLSLLDGKKLGDRNPLLVYGRVPLFFYVIHVGLIHALAMIGLWITGKDPGIMVIDLVTLNGNELSGYGYSLGIVYLVWIGIVLALYPASLWYMNYKRKHPEKKWLSYL